MEIRFLLLLSCSLGIPVTGVFKESASKNDVEHFVMVKVNRPECVQSNPHVRETPSKRWDEGEMKEFWTGPTMCANCVTCAALVFGLVDEFVNGQSLREGDNQLDTVCDRRLPLFRIWDVSGIRYFGEPTVNARPVLKHESLTPSIQNVCQTIKNMTTGRDLYDLWRHDKSRFMNRMCFNPYAYPGLASCRGLIKRTKGIDRMKVCRKPFWAYVLERIFFWDSTAYKYCEEKEYQTLLSWYTLGSHDYVE